MNATVSSICVACMLVSASCASMPVASPASLPQECPSVVLRRSDGLVPDQQSGLIAAVWSQGVIVRTRTMRGPVDGYVVGRAPASEFAELLKVVQSDDVWDAPRSEVVLDMADEELLLKRGDERRVWAQTPGLTATRVIQRVRSAIFAVALENPSPLRGPVRENWTCSPATWR